MHPKVKAYLNSVVIRDGQKWIDGDVDLFGLNLTELSFHDINVDGYFNCANNKLTTLEGSPKTVNGNLTCNANNLTNLEGSPETVNGYFDCSNNKLTTLEGSSKTVKGNFWCHYNNNLTTLKGLGDVDGVIFINKPFNCDYYLQYILMGKIKI